LLLASPAFALSELKHTVCPSGCDYSSLNAAITHIEGSHANLVTADVYANVEISGDWTSSPDTTVVDMSGITTDATRFLSIYTTGDAVHDGTYGGNAKAYSLEVGGTGNIFTSTDVRYLRVYGLQFKQTTTSNTHGASLITYGASDIRFYGNILKGVLSGGATGIGAIVAYGSNASSVHYIYNNIIYDWINGGATCRGIWASGTNGNVYTYNNTFHNDYVGVHNAGSGATIYSYNNGFASVSTTYSGTVSGKTGDSTTTPTFVSEGGDDFHLQSSDTTWKDQTSDQSSGLFTDDIDFETRTGSWDIGADEYVSAGAAGRVIMVY
jgi:hypothetical protein